MEDRPRRGVGEHAGGDRRAVDRAIAEAEEDRLGVAARREQVPRAVVLLVGPRLLVLADLAGPILRDLDAADEPELRLAVHHLAVEVDRRLRVANERALLDHRLQVAVGDAVDLRVVAVDLGGEVDLGADHVQEGVRLAGGALAGLLGRDHVVGLARDVGGEASGWAQGGERMDPDHPAGSP